ncbi:MAG: hypothetical protein AABM41_09775, partial [Chloroflexota bacterium]
MTDRELNATALFASAGMAVVYLASLSIVFAQEAERPNTLLLAVFAPSVLAGLLIRRYWAIGLAVGVVAVFFVWFSLVEEDAP